MKIHSVEVSSFRGYKDPVKIEIDNLCVLVGKNDIGKSTILEALDIFFNEGKPGYVKLDKDDINRDSIGESEIEISVEFCDLPQEIVLDVTNSTTLESEYLLTEAGTLKIIKRYSTGLKEKVFVRAFHPCNQNCKDLHQKKISQLKRIVNDGDYTCDNMSKSASLRRAIWDGQESLEFEEQEIEIGKMDQKGIWEQLKTYMPLYALFQADRSNSDGDSEIQDPMKLAVNEILQDPFIQDQLANIAGTVKNRLAEVAQRTVEKLREMNPEIANTLQPHIPEMSRLKWADVFKNVSISGDEEIPINKRGSGVKRLILINFFRGEAERRMSEQNLPNIVYAIEEPETAQHPKHQRLLINALIDLGNSTNSQVFLTTHSPEIVKELEFENIYLIADRNPSVVERVSQNELPYLSLNEVNYLAFGELPLEYHIELYGYIESEGFMRDFEQQQSKKPYNKLQRDGSTSMVEVSETTYIRHQIHHPENTHNQPFGEDDLKRSVEAMRLFIQEHDGLSQSMNTNV